MELLLLKLVFCYVRFCIAMQAEDFDEEIE